MYREYAENRRKGPNISNSFQEVSSKNKMKEHEIVTEDLVHTDGSCVCIGDRLQCEGFIATLKYIGEVPPTKGVWLGVEWDDKERGKHNGTHEGNTYFKTRDPKSGSFIRPKKADFGVSFMAAVKDRYGRIEDENAGVITEDLYVVGGKNQTTVVEMVGARKVNDLQSKIDELKEVVVRASSIYNTPSSDDLSVLVPNIRDLDVSQNLLVSWKQIAQITVQLKNLKSLNVSDNVLEFPEKASDLISSFSHVRVLYLNRMYYSWEKVLQCCDMFPNLTQIHACFNCIQTLSSLEGRLQSVQLVNLESNNISDWSQLYHLAKLPLLETLIMSSNSIETINVSTDQFTSLKSLSMNDNKVKDWSSINELNNLLGLEDLRLKSNPIMSAESIDTVRQLLIAKLKHLKMCNRTVVHAEERKGAEIDYLKRFGTDWVKSGGHQDPAKNKPSAEFVKNHPRYQDLIDRWGAPEDSEMKKQSTSLKNSLLVLKITCPSLPDAKTMEKKLPGTMTVQKLKAFVHRLYKIDSDIQLSYVSQKMVGQEFELDNDQKHLSFYSIESGDVIQVKI